MCRFVSGSLCFPINNPRVMREVERTLRRALNTRHIEYNKSKIEERKLEIRGLLATLNTPLDKNIDTGGRDPHSAHETATTSVSESGTPSPPAPVDLLRRTNPPRFINVKTPACTRLIKRAFAPEELPSLVEAVFSSKVEGDMIRGLVGDDAQVFIDVIDEVRSTFVHYREPEN